MATCRTPYYLRRMILKKRCLFPLLLLGYLAYSVYLNPGQTQIELAALGKHPVMELESLGEQGVGSVVSVEKAALDDAWRVENQLKKSVETIAILTGGHGGIANIKSQRLVIGLDDPVKMNLIHGVDGPPNEHQAESEKKAWAEWNAKIKEQAAASKAIADAQAAGTPLTPKQLGALSGYVTTPPPPPPPTPPPTPTAPPTPTPLPAPASPTGQPQAAEALEGMDGLGMRRLAASINKAQPVLNSHLLPTDQAALAALPVIVLMVHNRPKYFQTVVASLRAMKGHDEAVLVVSLDYLSTAMDEVTRSIDFMPVVQIVCPASAQFFPDSFPGTDPKDCAGGWDSLTKEKAKSSGCINWATPDKYGHYREAKFTAVKHHWWWQFNFVFNKLALPGAVGRGHTGYVMYVEEDNYLAPDALAVLKQMVDLTKSARECGHDGSGCMINMGLKRQEAVSDNGNSWTAASANTAKVAGWESSKHNMGMGFNAAFWAKVAGCSNTFCHYDDYNWDWTLEATLYGGNRDAASCPALHASASPPAVLVLQGARLYHFGSCGVHVGKGQECEGQTADTSGIQNMLKKVEAYLYPSQLHLSGGSFNKPRAIVNGGWADARDLALCDAFGRGEQLEELGP